MLRVRKLTCTRSKIVRLKTVKQFYHESKQPNVHYILLMIILNRKKYFYCGIDINLMFKIKKQENIEIRQKVLCVNVVYIYTYNNKCIHFILLISLTL